MADLSGTITSGGNAQTIAGFNPARKALIIQNTSDTDMWVAFGTTAVAASPSFLIEAGNQENWGDEHRTLICRAISVIGATTGKAFTAFDVQ
jgi:hypothetical protein